MIINCYSCGKRISDQVRTCPHCGTALAELTSEERAELERRQLRRRLFQARTVTQIAMGVVVIALLWWWLGGEPLMLDFPAPLVPLTLVVLGLLGYLGGWGWLLYLRWDFRRSR